MIKYTPSDWDDCKKCTLHKARLKREMVVMGTTPRADRRFKYLFVYGCPEVEDVHYGEPADGPTVSVLKDMISSLSGFTKITLDECAFIPVVGCRSFVLVPATDEEKSHTVEVDPNKVCVDACAPRLYSYIYKVDPLLIFTAGPVAWKTLVRPVDRDHTSLANALGELSVARFNGYKTLVRYPVIPLANPADIIKNPSVADHGPQAIMMKSIIKGVKYVTQLIKGDDA